MNLLEREGKRFMSDSALVEREIVIVVRRRTLGIRRL